MTCMLVTTHWTERKSFWNMFLVWELIFLCRNSTDATEKNRGLTSGRVRNFLLFCTVSLCRSQWPRGLRRRSSATRLLRLWVRIPPAAWMFVCCECCVLSGRGFCNGLITRPEESCRLWRVVVRDQETSKTRRLTLNLLTTTIVAPPSNASKWQMGFNSAFKGLKPGTGLWKYNHNWL